jgi:deoxyhypusine synthase
LVQHKLVDALVTTAGGIEEDMMKCILPHHLGDFEKYKGPALRLRGINRIGNLLVRETVSPWRRRRAKKTQEQEEGVDL